MKNALNSFYNKVSKQIERITEKKPGGRSGYKYLNTENGLLFTEDGITAYSLPGMQLLSLDPGGECRPLRDIWNGFKGLASGGPDAGNAEPGIIPGELYRDGGRDRYKRSPDLILTRFQTERGPAFYNSKHFKGLPKNAIFNAAGPVNPCRVYIPDKNGDPVLVKIIMPVRVAPLSAKNFIPAAALEA